MKSLRAMIFAAFACIFASLPAAADDAYAKADPRSVVQTVLALTDSHALPDWPEPTFAKKLRPYLTDDFLRVVAKGSRIAEEKQINLYDGDFFTGGQGEPYAKLMGADVVKQAGDAATVDALVHADPAATVDMKVRYELKRVGGQWMIDDFRFFEDSGQSRPSIKTMFGDPTKYGG
jgi:hypothetical protein